MCGESSSYRLCLIPQAGGKCQKSGPDSVQVVAASRLCNSILRSGNKALPDRFRCLNIYNGNKQQFSPLSIV